MSIDQALFEMELVGHDFFLFRDSERGNPSVVYRRRGYQYGVLRLVEEQPPQRDAASPGMPLPALADGPSADSRAGRPGRAGRNGSRRNGRAGRRGGSRRNGKAGQPAGQRTAIPPWTGGIAAADQEVG